jgi:hypothetical protein
LAAQLVMHCCCCCYPSSCGEGAGAEHLLLLLQALEWFEDALGRHEGPYLLLLLLLLLLL